MYLFFEFHLMRATGLNILPLCKWLVFHPKTLFNIESMLKKLYLEIMLVVGNVNKKKVED